MSREIYARAGSDYLAWGWMPTPVSGDIVVTARTAGGDVIPVVTQIRAEATVTAVATDRKTATVSLMAGAMKGVQGEKGGHAHFRTERHGVHALRVRHILSTTQVVFDAPLPFVFTAGAGGADLLSWSTWHWTFTSAAVTGTALARPIPYTIAWTADNGVDMPAEAMRHEGLLYVVRQPFETAVDDDVLLQVVPSLAGVQPLRQGSWQPQIDMALGMLRRWIRRDLQADSLTEHAVNGAAFREVHAFLAAWLVMQGANAASANRAEARDDYLATAKALYADVTASWPWIDSDGDGAVDAGETEVTQRIGSDATRSLFDGNDTDFVSADFPVFSRNMKH